MLILGERHLRRVLKEYAAYLNRARPHQGLEQRVPQPRPMPPPAERGGTVVFIPVFGGLHHDSQRAA